MQKWVEERGKVASGVISPESFLHTNRTKGNVPLYADKVQKLLAV